MVVKENALRHSHYWKSTSLASFLFCKNVEELNVQIITQKYKSFTSAVGKPLLTPSDVEIGNNILFQVNVLLLNE